MGAHSDTTDYHEANAFGVQRLKERSKVELAQCALAAPLIALICLQSA
jgi:hypothetical protein